MSKKRVSLTQTYSSVEANMSRAKGFLTFGLWRIKVRQLPPPRAVMIKALRAIVQSLIGFHKDKCQLRASALTFYSLLSVVPVLAMLFGIAKGFGLEQRLENQLVLKGQETAVQYLISFAKKMLENSSGTGGGLVAGVGVILLFWSVISLLGSIEQAFNAIWGVKKDRSIGRKFTDYLSAMLLCPLLFVVSISITMLINSKVQVLTSRIELLGSVAPYITSALNLTSIIVIWLLFSFIYIFMPNTKVQYGPGILAGIAAGTIFQIVQWAYIIFQVGVAKYSAVYGSFAALPLFLIWLQTSWLVILYGAELAFAFQNVDTYEFETDCLQASSAFKRLLTLRIVQLLVKRFVDGLPPLCSAEIGATLDMPIRLVRQLVFDLTECGIVSVVQSENGQPRRYQPARDVRSLSVAAVVAALEQHGKDEIPIAESPEFDRLKATMRTFGETLAASPANRLLQDY